MSFNVAMLRALQAEGLDLAACIRVFEAGEKKADPTAAARKRRQREKEQSERDMSQRDVTRDGFPNESNLTLPEDSQFDEASASSPLRQPISEARSIWDENAAAAGWPTVQALSATRQRCLGARLRQHGIDGWRAAITRARASPYLGGTDPPSWFTFNWIIKAENFLKLSEGNYDRSHRENADPTTVALARVQEHFRSRDAVN